MPPGLPKPDNAPLDPGGQAPGQVASIGINLGDPASAGLLAPPEASGTVSWRRNAFSSMEPDFSGLPAGLGSAIPLQRPLKAPRKRLQDESPENRERAPAKALFNGAYKDMEEALLGHIAGANRAMFIELDAIKAHMTSLVKDFEHRLGARLDAMEARIASQSTAWNRPNAPNQPLKPPTPGGGRQGRQQAHTAHGTSSNEVAHGPATNPNRHAKPAEPRRASSPISKRPPPTKPAPQAAPGATGAPQWADIAANNAHEWQTVTKKRQTAPKPLPRVQAHPGSIKPIRTDNKEDRRLIFRRQDGGTAPKDARQDVILHLNRYLAQAGFPAFARVADANYTDSGAISVLMEPGTTAGALLPAYWDPLVAACRRADPAVISVEPNLQWHKLKVHAVPVARYSAPGSGLALAREEIELGGACTLMRDPTWIKPLATIQATGQRASTIVITVGSLEDARSLLPRGIRFGGNRHEVTPYYDVGKDSVCTRCCGIGHRAYRACGSRPELCLVCAGPHEAQNHACNVQGCTAKPCHPCPHAPTKCANCGGKHQADSPSCPKLREVRRRPHKRFPAIEVVMPAPTREYEAWDGITDENSPPAGPASPEAAPENEGQDTDDEAMAEALAADLPTSPVPYSSPCPQPTPGAVPNNADHSA